MYSIMHFMNVKPVYLSGRFISDFFISSYYNKLSSGVDFVVPVDYSGSV